MSSGLVICSDLLQPSNFSFARRRIGPRIDRPARVHPTRSRTETAAAPGNAPDASTIDHARDDAWLRARSHARALAERVPWMDATVGRRRAASCGGGIVAHSGPPR